MKFLKKVFILFVFSISNLVLSQVSENIIINKKNILKVLESTIDQSKRNRIVITSNPWSTKTENYIKADTIKFINPSNKIDKNYCNLINWTFYRKNKFVRSYGNYCNEPPTEKVTNKNDYFDLKIIETEKKIFLELHNQEKIIEKFEVISLNKRMSLSYNNKNEYLLTLKRLK